MIYLIYRNKHRLRQNEETKEYVSIKEQRELNKMKISNMPDKPFKVMIISISPNSREVWMNTKRTSTKR